MTTLTNSIAALAIVGLFAGISGPASADSPPNSDRAEAVRTSDLDLGKPADVETLYGRIQSKAHSLCRTEHWAPWNVKRVLRTRACIEQSVDRAVARANEPALSALHQRTGGQVARR